MKEVRKAEKVNRLKPLNYYNQEGNSRSLPAYTTEMKTLHRYGYIRGAKL